MYVFVWFIRGSLSLVLPVHACLLEGRETSRIFHYVQKTLTISLAAA